MCDICAAMRPWTPECDYAGTSSTGSGGARADLPWLTPEQIGRKLATDYWNVEEPLHWDVRPGDVITYDLSLMQGDGKSFAESALREWEIVTGIRFEEVSGGFVARRTLAEDEAADAASGVSTGYAMAVGDVFDGGLAPGDDDWVRLDLPSQGTLTLRLDSQGTLPLDLPRLTIRDADGVKVPLDIVHYDGFAEIDLDMGDAGGTYYAQVSSDSDAMGFYRLTVADWSDFRGVDIYFTDDEEGAWARSEYHPEDDGVIVFSHINVHPDWWADAGFEDDTYVRQAFVHEIGHALGLGHPGDYNGEATYGEHAEYVNDSWQTSVMSYFPQDRNPHTDHDFAYVATPMIGDIEAIRMIYGEADVRPGDTVYGHGSDAGGMIQAIDFHDHPLAYTILDTGGHDVVQLGPETEDQRLDLRPGAVSDVMGVRGGMTIAVGTILEEAWLGSGDDVVRGNDAANLLVGGAGRDRIGGGAGHDDLAGQGGDDRLKGGSGDDVLLGGRGRDKMKGGGGDDALDGGEGKDKLWGGAGGDLFLMGAGFGKDSIKDFDGDEGDWIDLSAVAAIASWGDLVSDHLKAKKNKVVIDAGEDGVLKLLGVSLGDLEADHFFF